MFNAQHKQDVSSFFVAFSELYRLVSLAAYKFLNSTFTIAPESYPADHAYLQSQHAKWWDWNNITSKQFQICGKHTNCLKWGSRCTGIVRVRLLKQSSVQIQIHQGSYCVTRNRYSLCSNQTLKIIRIVFIWPSLFTQTKKSNFSSGSKKERFLLKKNYRKS